MKHCQQFFLNEMTVLYQEVQTILVHMPYIKATRLIGFISLAIWSWFYVVPYLLMWREIQKYFPLHGIPQCDNVRHFSERYLFIC